MIPLPLPRISLSGWGKRCSPRPWIQVREVLDVLPFTHIPYAPSFYPHSLCAVFPARYDRHARRGRVPVIDLRARFRLSDIALILHHRIISVWEALVEGTPLILEALTDWVYEVTALDSPPPSRRRPTSACAGVPTSSRASVAGGIGSPYHRHRCLHGSA